jgi:hypothetical protein
MKPSFDHLIYRWGISQWKKEKRVELKALQAHLTSDDTKAHVTAAGIDWQKWLAVVQQLLPLIFSLLGSGTTPPAA